MPGLRLRQQSFVKPKQLDILRRNNATEKTSYYARETDPAGAAVGAEAAAKAPTDGGSEAACARGTEAEAPAKNRTEAVGVNRLAQISRCSRRGGCPILRAWREEWEAITWTRPTTFGFATRGPGRQPGLIPSPGRGKTVPTQCFTQAGLASGAAITYHNVHHCVEIAMPTIIVRNLPEETHRALKFRAAAHRRNTKAEVREFLDQAVRPPERLKIGSELAALGRKLGGTRLKVRRDAAETSAAEFD